MFALFELVDGQQYLANLMRLGLVVLNVDARIVWPGCFDNGVAGARLPWCPKERLTYFKKLGEPYIGRFPPHLVEDFRGRRLLSMASIMAPLYQRGGTCLNRHFFAQLAQPEKSHAQRSSGQQTPPNSSPSRHQRQQRQQKISTLGNL
jgi:hypothetical protein